MNTWNAIYVSSRQEKKIQEKLSEKGIEAYVPLKKILSQWSDRKKWISQPLISGYVFVKSTPAVKAIVMQTKGVVAFVKYNGKDAIIRNSEIETLKSIEKHGYEINTTSEKFNPGDSLQIFQGPLKGLSVKVIEIANDDTICAFLMESIGQNFRIRLPKALLKKEDSHVGNH